MSVKGFNGGLTHAHRGHCDDEIRRVRGREREPILSRGRGLSRA